MSAINNNSASPDESHSLERVWPENVPIPLSFLCALTNRLMKHPVIDREGNSYEKKSILDYIRRNWEPGSGHSVPNPVSNNPLNESDLVDNKALMVAIESGWKHALHFSGSETHARRPRNRKSGRLKTLSSSMKAAMPINLRMSFGSKRSSMMDRDRNTFATFVINNEIGNAENSNGHGRGKTSSTITSPADLPNRRASENDVTAGGYDSGEGGEAGKTEQYQPTGDESFDAEVAAFLQAGTLGTSYRDIVSPSHSQDSVPKSQQPNSGEQKAIGKPISRKDSTESLNKKISKRDSSESLNEKMSRRDSSGSLDKQASRKDSIERLDNKISRKELSMEGAVRRKVTLDKAAEKFEERLRRKLSEDPTARSKLRRKNKKTSSVKKLLADTASKKNDRSKAKKSEHTPEQAPRISPKAIDFADYVPKSIGEPDLVSSNNYEELLQRKVAEYTNTKQSTREQPKLASSNIHVELLQRKVNEYTNTQPQKQSSREQPKLASSNKHVELLQRKVNESKTTQPQKQSTREQPDLASCTKYEELIQRKVNEFTNTRSQKRRSNASSAHKKVHEHSHKGSENKKHGLSEAEADADSKKGVDYLQIQESRRRNRRERRNTLDQKIRNSMTNNSVTIGMVPRLDLEDLREDLAQSDSTIDTADYAKVQEVRRQRRRDSLFMLDSKIRQSLTSAPDSMPNEGDLHEQPNYFLPMPVRRTPTTNSGESDSANETGNPRATRRTSYNQRASLDRMDIYTRRVSDLTCASGICSSILEEDGISDSNHSILSEIGLEETNHSHPGEGHVDKSNHSDYSGGSLAERLTGGEPKALRRSSTGHISENSQGIIHRKVAPTADQPQINDIPDRKKPPADLLERSDSVISWSALDGEIERAQFMSMTIANTGAMQIQSEMETFLAAGIEVEPAPSNNEEVRPAGSQRRARGRRGGGSQQQNSKDKESLGNKVEALMVALEGSGKTQFDVMNALKGAKGDKDKAMSMLLN